MHHPFPYQPINHVKFDNSLKIMTASKALASSLEKVEEILPKRNGKNGIYMDSSLTDFSILHGVYTLWLQYTFNKMLQST
jgi:hypothetical protein